MFARSILIPFRKIFTEHLNQFSSIVVAAHWKHSAVVMSGCGHRGRSSVSSLALRADSPREEPPDSPGVFLHEVRETPNGLQNGTEPSEDPAQPTAALADFPGMHPHHPAVYGEGRVLQE